jgi:hypothetical protein
MKVGYVGRAVVVFFSPCGRRRRAAPEEGVAEPWKLATFK